MLSFQRNKWWLASLCVVPTLLSAVALYALTRNPALVDHETELVGWFTTFAGPVTALIGTKAFGPRAPEWVSRAGFTFVCAAVAVHMGLVLATVLRIPQLGFSLNALRSYNLVLAVTQTAVVTAMGFAFP